MPWIDNRIDEVSSTQFLTKIDLLKGFYQVPLGQRERKMLLSYRMAPTNTQ